MTKRTAKELLAAAKAMVKLADRVEMLVIPGLEEKQKNRMIWHLHNGAHRITDALKKEFKESD